MTETPIDSVALRGHDAVMKHERHLNDADRSDLETAAFMVAEGRALRRRVFTRLRARAFRERAKGGNDGTV